MIPSLPKSALPIFGQDVSPDGAWGGVPWMHGVPHPEPLEGMLNGNVTLFPYAQSKAVLAISDSDNDLDGPGGSKRVDPCWQGQTSLRALNGASCDSRQFPGVVISPALKSLGVRLSDFCLVSWNGVVRSAQVYDIGPTRKTGENSIFLNRGLGIVPATKNDHWAAEVGHDAQDVCTLIFAGSGPGHALSPDQIIANSHRLWAAFTSRPAPDTISGGKAVAASGGIAATAPAAKGVATAGSAGIAAPLFLVTISTLGLLAPVLVADGHVDPTPETLKGWLEVFAYLAGLILLVVNLVKAFRPDPSSDKKFATKTEMERVEKESKERDDTHKQELARSERASEAKHTENVRKIEEVKGTLDRNHKEDHQERAKLRDDVRHDLRQEVQPLQTKIDEHTADVAKGFQSLAGEIGGLKVAKDASDAHAAEVRRTLQILLSRTAPNRGGGAQE